MDISHLSYNSIPFSWISPVGNISSSNYDDKYNGWYKSFSGGFLTTCGLSNIGLPCNDEGKDYGLHGRISNIKAENIHYENKWFDEDCVFTIQGTVIESIAFEYTFELNRKITAFLNSPRMIIEDSIENKGHLPAPYMILYHFNIGWPIIDENAKIILRNSKTTPMNDEAKKTGNYFDTFYKPLENTDYEIYLHEISEDQYGFSNISIINKEFLNKNGIGISLKYTKKELPYLIQFKKKSKGDYFCSLEPASNFENRIAQRQNNHLKFLGPYEKITNLLELNILTLKSEITDLLNYSLR